MRDNWKCEFVLRITRPPAMLDRDLIALLGKYGMDALDGPSLADNGIELCDEVLRVGWHR